jgi:hypothetical protein
MTWVGLELLLTDHLCLTKRHPRALKNLTTNDLFLAPISARMEMAYARGNLVSEAARHVDIGNVVYTALLFARSLLQSLLLLLLLSSPQHGFICIKISQLMIH